MGDYRFCLRYPSPGEYQCYLYCYDLRQQTLDRPVGRVSFANGEYMEFTARRLPPTIREELPTKDGTGFLFETLTDAPAVRKAVDDMVYDLYGREPQTAGGLHCPPWPGDGRAADVTTQNRQPVLRCVLSNAAHPGVCEVIPSPSPSWNIGVPWNF